MAHDYYKSNFLLLSRLPRSLAVYQNRFLSYAMYPLSIKQPGIINRLLPSRLLHHLSTVKSMIEMITQTPCGE